MIWLVGSGGIAIEYARVLDALKVQYLTIGRGKKSSNNFSLIIGKKVISGGLSNFLKTKPAIPKKVIVAVNIEESKSTCTELISYGIKHILLEKPGGVNFEEVSKLYNFAKRKKVDIKIAYNRRYYSSTLKVKELINQDGGIKSFNFDFTEWLHEIESLGKSDQILRNWFFANSSHVVDLSFFLGGLPTEMVSYFNNSIMWNKSFTIFSGAGKTKNGAIFSYKANWKSAGRWSVEILTNKGKYKLSPLEKLFFQKKGSLKIKEINLNSKYDKVFKPGFYAQLKAFIYKKNDNHLLSLSEHRSMLSIYRKISGLN